jgi:hypothetical protein
VGNVVDTVEFDGMVILTGVDDGVGSVADPQNRANITLKYTGTLWKYLNYPRLTDFTITNVDGTFIKKTTTGVISQTQLVSYAADNLLGMPSTYTTANVVDSGGAGTTNAEATITVTNNNPTSITITDGGSGYEIGDVIQFLGTDIFAGATANTAILIQLTAPIMVANYEQLRVNLEQVYIRAEDITGVDNSTLKFTIYNTLDYDLNYKYSNILRAYSSL